MIVLHAYVQGAMLKIVERPKSVMEVNESWMWGTLYYEKIWDFNILAALHVM
jgi:hypothetical protein